MLTILKKIDENQEKINQAALDRVGFISAEYFRIGLTYSSNAIEGNSLTDQKQK